MYDSEPDREAAKRRADAGLTGAESRVARDKARLGQLPGQINEAGQIEAEHDRANHYARLINAQVGKNNETLEQIEGQLKLSHDQQLDLNRRILDHVISLKDGLAELKTKYAQLEFRSDLPSY